MGNRTSRRRARHLGKNTVRRAQGPSVSPPLLWPLWRAGTKPPPFGPIRRLYGRDRPLGAQRLPVPAPGPSGPRRPLWAARDRSRRRLYRPASCGTVRGLPGCLFRR